MIVTEKEEELKSNPLLTQKVEKDSPLKEWLVRL
jgi:hypothetical protein